MLTVKIFLRKFLPVRYYHNNDMTRNKISVIDSLSKNKRFIVKSGENRTFFICLTDGESVDGKVEIIIEGKAANVQILGAIVGYGKQIIKLFSLQDHLREESVSDLLIKSVLFEEAKLYYEGLIRIEKGAQHSNAYQKNQNLLLSKTSWADSRPKLEILANDVRCTHGATIGKIGKDELYYLQTRGLGQTAATRLIVDGFFTDVVKRVPDESIQEELSKALTSRINTLLYKEVN